MDSIEILERYLTGGAQRQETRRAFKDLLSTAAFSERTKIRYAYGTFIRYTMYMSGEASAFEFLIKLRDLILYDRRVLCGNTVGQLVDEFGAQIGLYRDQMGYANAKLMFPDWLDHEDFVRNTYDLVDFRDEDTYCIGDRLLSSAVKKFHTYKSFEIKTAVHTALQLPDGYTLLASLPTGAGKSLITQMVSYYSAGLTIVVVPTVALAIDQYSAAIGTLNDDFKSHIYYYKGGQSEQDYAQIMDGLKTRKARLLFISPEALLKNGALNTLLSNCAKTGYLKNVVIDEAHIVPDWGILFRPDFQILAFAMKHWKELSNKKLKTYLLSATLPDDTVDVLKHLFAPDGQVIEYRCDALRREPQFCFYETKSVAKRWKAVEEAITLLPKPMIVYFLEPAEILAFHKRLSEHGYKNVQVFTGETKSADREQILEDWKNEKFDVILATSAFGIGVDKGNVRTVVHACVPENLSRFYQEVGRAGRDGYASLSVLIPYTGKDNNGSDLEKAHSLVRGRVLRVETMVSRWKGLREAALVSGDIIDVDSATIPPYFTEEASNYAGEHNSVWNINLLLFLHRINFIDILNVRYRAETNSYHFTARVLKTNELSDGALMAESITDLRAAELSAQLDGYFRMKEIVQRPGKRCWGAAFHDLYPLTNDCCNGCPKHSRNTYVVDDQHRIRANIDHKPAPKPTTPKLSFAMGSYDSMIIRNNHFPQLDMTLLAQVVNAMNKAGLSVLVGAEEIVSQLDFEGLILTRDEFSFLVSVYPGLFSGGVFAIFDQNEHSNSALFSNIKKLHEYGYKTVLYCSDDMYIHGFNRRVTDFLNCKIRNPRELIERNEVHV
jgi:hypothetical protein